MNKYKQAYNVIDTILHLMCGEEREDGYKPTQEEMSKAMADLKELVEKGENNETKNLIIKMVNGDEYHLYNTKGSILMTRNFDDMNFLEIDNTIAKEIIHVTYFYKFHRSPPLDSKEKVLSRVSINSKNIASIDYLEE